MKRKKPVKPRGVDLSKGKKYNLLTVVRRYRKLLRIDFVLALIFAGSLFLRWGVPANIITNSPHDDFLGVDLARNILNGNWLGEWNNRTLLKPPGYSIYLALIYPFRLDPVVFLHFLILIVLLVFSLYASNNFPATSLSTKFKARVIFAFLAFNPALLGGDFSRVYRVSLNTFAILIFVTTIFYLIIKFGSLRSDLLTGNASHVDRRSKQKIYFVFGISGFSYALMVLTRTEAFWLALPLLGIISLYGISLVILRKKSSLILRKKLRSVLGILGVGGLIAVTTSYIPIGLVQQANLNKYQVTLVENFTTGQFSRAIALWQSVEVPGEVKPFSVPVSTKGRQAVYKVSKIASDLSPYLDGPPNTGWKTFNCQATQICDESGGGWFPFELRDAMVTAKNVSSEADFQRYFKELADDIQSACSDGKLKCGAKGTAPGVVSITSMPKKQLIENASRVFRSWLNLEQALNTDRPDTSNEPSQVAIWSSVVNAEKVVAIGPNEEWKVFGGLIGTLKSIYFYILNIGFVFALIGLLKPVRDRTDFSSRFVPLYLLSSLIIFSFGIGVLSIAWGFPAGLSIYALPAQPVFLMFIVLGILSLLRQVDKDKVDS